jgi:DNA-binding MarR family transcriptional regulator
MKDTYYIFRLLFFITQKWQKNMDRKLDRQAGITTRQWMLMVVLSRHFRDRLPTLGETANAFGTSRQNLKRIALDLQRKGYLIIIQDPADQRVQRLTLTGKHAEDFEGEDNLKWQEDLIRELFVGLDADEQARLSKSLYRLMKRAEQMDE